MSSRSIVVAVAIAVVASVTSPWLASSPAQNANIGATLVDRYIAAFNNHDADALAEIIAEKYVQHNGRAGQGIAGTQATIKSYFATFPDMHMQLEDTVISGDKGRRTDYADGDHSHPVQLGPGAPVFQPTGKKLTWGDIDIWRIADGKFVEHWDQADLAGLARQMRGD
jgi:predicted ester cyclase